MHDDEKGNVFVGEGDLICVRKHQIGVPGQGVCVCVCGGGGGVAGPVSCAALSYRQSRGTDPHGRAGSALTAH